jgi:hypothetical protein
MNKTNRSEFSANLALAIQKANVVQLAKFNNVSPTVHARVAKMTQTKKSFRILGVTLKF